MEVDVQPHYVRVTVKGKIFQMALNEEVRIEESTSQRSLTTGHLLIVMPKLNVKNFLIAKKGKHDDKLVKKTQGLKAAVNIREIVIDDSEIPPLI